MATLEIDCPVCGEVLELSAEDRADLVVGDVIVCDSCNAEMEVTRNGTEEDFELDLLGVLTNPAYLTSALVGAVIAYLMVFGSKWTFRALFVADCLSVGCWAATGTVKARLSRGRAALGDLPAARGDAAQVRAPAAAPAPVAAPAPAPAPACGRCR